MASPLYDLNDRYTSPTDAQYYPNNANQPAPMAQRDCPSGSFFDGERCIPWDDPKPPPTNNNCGPDDYFNVAEQKCKPIGGPNPPQWPGPGGSDSSSGGTKVTGSTPTYTPTKSPYDPATSKSIFDLVQSLMNGTTQPFGPDMIARMQAAALQSNKGQLQNSRQEIQKRLINSGLSRSGVAPATFQKLESASAADFSNNLREIATTAAKGNFDSKMLGLREAQNFLQSERANSLSQDQLLLSYARLKQERDLTQATFDQQWKIIQDGNEQRTIQLMICLRTRVC